ncbi:MAG: hypothetical protein K9G64_09150 [Bacteroidia bacterium]|nr:hypothetical protein [Bacteroidia bacterium]
MKTCSRCGAYISANYGYCSTCRIEESSRRVERTNREVAESNRRVEESNRRVEEAAYESIAIQNINNLNSKIFDIIKLDDEAKINTLFLALLNNDSEWDIYLGLQNSSAKHLNIFLNIMSKRFASSIFSCYDFKNCIDNITRNSYNEHTNKIISLTWAYIQNKNKIISEAKSIISNHNSEVQNIKSILNAEEAKTHTIIGVQNNIKKTGNAYETVKSTFLSDGLDFEAALAYSALIFIVYLFICMFSSDIDFSFTAFLIIDGIFLLALIVISMMANNTSDNQDKKLNQTNKNLNLTQANLDDLNSKLNFEERSYAAALYIAKLENLVINNSHSNYNNSYSNDVKNQPNQSGANTQMPTVKNQQNQFDATPKKANESNLNRSATMKTSKGYGFDIQFEEELNSNEINLLTDFINSNSNVHNKFSINSKQISKLNLEQVDALIYQLKKIGIKLLDKDEKRIKKVL